MLISVIIPVYNKQNYLEDCIVSVSSQEYENLEIIIINDGSVDNSEEIIKKWIEKDSRIRYFSHSNKGVADTRNRGISIARGEYIFLLDADDLLEKKAISKLINYIKYSDADIVIGNYYEKNNEKLIKKSHYKTMLIENYQLNKIETKVNLFMINGRSMAMAGNKLYKTEFIKKHKIQFINNVIAEDRLFNLICYLHNPLIQIASDYTYIYNVYNESRSKTVNSNYVNESISLFTYFYSYLKKESKLEDQSDLLRLTLMYDLNKILSYTIRYSDRRVFDTISAIKNLKENTLVTTTVPIVVKDSRFRKVKDKSFNRMYYNVFLFYYAPRLLVIYKIFGRLYQKIIKLFKSR